MRTRRIIWQAVVLAMAAVAVPGKQSAVALTPAEVRSRMESVQKDLNVIGEQLERAGHRLEVAIEATLTHRRTLAEADDRREELREVVNARAAQLYMLGTTAEFAIGDDMADIAERISYIDEIDRSSRIVLEEIRALEEHAKETSARLNDALEDAQSAREELAARRGQVSSRLSDLSRLYQFLRSIDPRGAARASRGSVNGFVCPVAGPHVLMDNFGAPRPGGPHTGDDMSADSGTGVRAVLPGTIVDTPWGGWIGIGIVLRDIAGNEWWYAHLGSSFVRSGQTVRAGEAIGRVGCTGRCYGPHLHFEYHPGGGSPVDPYRILSAAC